MQTALLLIDAQESFRRRPYWVEAAAAAFFRHANALIEGCVAAGVPIVRVLHADSPDEPGSPFTVVSGFVRPLEGLVGFSPAAEFVKHRHSALVGTGLTVWLHQHTIGRLIVAGIRTEQCCETTTRHASDEGYAVDYCTDATLTFDMHHVDGSPLPVAEIVARTTAVLAGRFATLCTVDQALARAR